MEAKKIEKFLQNYKRGCYTTIIKKTEKDGFIKVTRLVCRFVNYYNIKAIKEKATTGAPRAYEVQIIPHILKLNTNTNNLLLCVYTTHHHKAHATYFYKDAQISEEEYYNGINEKKRASYPCEVMTFKACEVVSLGGMQ